MKKVKRILVPTDFSKNADQALQFAAMLALKFESEIILLHVVSLFQDDPNNPAYQFPDVDSILESVEASARESLKALDIEHAGIPIAKKMIRGISPAESIITYASEENVDLIIMGTHGRTGLSHFLLGSVAERVIRHMPCPVITIKGSGVRKPAAKLARIVVAVDFSNYSKLALAHAADLARAFDATVEVIHVIEEQVHPSFYITGETSIFKFNPELRDKSRKALRDFVHTAVIEPVSFDVHVREGRIHDEIVKYAHEQGADLIVVATHGLSGLDHFLIGSTTEKVVRKATVPVFTINARGITG